PAAARRSCGRPAPPRQARDRSYRRKWRAPFVHLFCDGRPSARADPKRNPMSRSTGRYARIGFVASPIAEARIARERLVGRYGNVDPEAADVVVALGGDGFMLQTLHRFMNSGKPIYGMHRGTIGFLMNDFSEDNLEARLTSAEITVIPPLLMRARDAEGRVREHYAINEVSLFRQIYQAARLRILVDGKERRSELIADGVLVAT